MKRRIELYINDQAADLSEDDLILFNYTKENIDNPSIVRNSYSKQVTLKGTARNNRIFEGMYRPDRVSGSGMSVLDRIPFAIIADKGVMIERGYCKIDSIKTEGSVHEYTVTLYGNLGDFFYKLTTDDNGDDLTLADLIYNGTITKTTHIEHNASGLNTLWTQLQTYLSDGTVALGAVVNFNPCYNGIPDNFDPTKLMVHAGDYNNTPASIQGYTPKSGANGKYIIETQSDYDPEERQYDMQDTNDCRAYLMRPMLSCRETIKAIQAYAATLGVTFTVDNAILNSLTTKRAWMAIANVPTEDRVQGYSTLGTLLAGTPSPASFIISFARVFGYSFVTDTDGNVTLTPRNVFFADTNVTDLSHRISLSGERTLEPVFAGARYFDFAFSGIGETAKLHKEQHGREYGSQRVDTSYTFGESTTNLYDGVPFKICADLIESGIDTTRATVMYRVNNGDIEVLSQPLLPIKQPTIYLKAEMYSGSTMQTVNIPFGWTSGDAGWATAIAEPSPAALFTRNQMCDADRKAITDIGALMMLDGFVTTQQFTHPLRANDPETHELYTKTITVLPRSFHLHSYDAIMVDLTGGKECWDMTQGEYVLSAIPAWRNTITGASILPTAIYPAFWEDYIADRYDKDARLLKCSVDFSGMQVGNNLLRKFYFFAGAIWVLNKINNYSLTTYDTVECEFVRVKDIADYNNGQTL